MSKVHISNRRVSNNPKDAGQNRVIKPGKVQGKKNLSGFYTHDGEQKREQEELAARLAKPVAAPYRRGE